MNPKQVEEFVDSLRNTFSLFEVNHKIWRTSSNDQTITIPTISAIDGIALGGGLEISLCCDIRIGGETKPDQAELTSVFNQGRNVKQAYQRPNWQYYLRRLVYSTLLTIPFIAQEVLKDLLG